jgi:hypothetical protein
MKKTVLLVNILIFCVSGFSQNAASIYTLKPNDAQAVYFTADNFNMKPDGKTDCTEELQKAINQAEVSGKFGIVFIPEGQYLLSNTIYIWKGIRLIGYGKNRPEFILKSKAPGYSSGERKFMVHFTSWKPEEGKPIRDANPGTFYSAISNIDFEIQDGNKNAVAIRSHFAQHCFITNVNFNIGDGKAGVDKVGNEISNCRFIGGDYGIITTKPSPSWPFLLIDSYFEGQKKAAIETEEGGFTMIRNHFKDVPSAIIVRPNREEKLFMEDCRFEDISGAGIVISDEYNASPQFNIKNLICINSPVLALFRRSEKKITGEGEFDVAVDSNGNVYVAAGQIFVYDKSGKQIDLIEVPERPSSIEFGGKDKKTLFIAAHSTLYSVSIK